jgi:anthranilate phosphoribosyltransferase
MKDILNHLFEHKTLHKEEAKEVLKNIALGKYNPAQMTAFMTVYLMRSITVDELEGFRDAMLELCIKVDLSGYDVIDVCGTGGDAKDTFNISTLSAFIVAASGVKVAKHGNYGVSSISGSSSVIEYFGYQFSNDVDHLKQKLDQAGICFMHAPLFHPAVKNVAPIRKELGIKTFFNMLGPMINPALPKYQLVGVFNLELARLYAYLYQKSHKQFIIVHTLDGYDEFSLTSPLKYFSKEQEVLLSPEDWGLEVLQASDLLGGQTVEESARIFEKILKGESTKAQRMVVCANAALAIHCVHPEWSPMDCIVLAQESLDSGRAYQTFKTFLN